MNAEGGAKSGSHAGPPLLKIQSADTPPSHRAVLIASPVQSIANTASVSSSPAPAHLGDAAGRSGLPYGSAAASEQSSEEGVGESLLARRDVVARALELGMDLQADRDWLWVAVEALEAPLPEGWEARTDAMGQAFYAHAASGETSRAHPLSEHYRKLYYSLKLERVGYRQLMLSRVDSTHVVDALALLSDGEARRMEKLFESHDRGRDGGAPTPEEALPEG